MRLKVLALLLAGSDIGVSIPLNSSTITSGYKAKNPSADVSAFFSSDKKNYNVLNFRK